MNFKKKSRKLTAPLYPYIVDKLYYVKIFATEVRTVYILVYHYIPFADFLVRLMPLRSSIGQMT
jgi:hypothetical protein